MAEARSVTTMNPLQQLGTYGQSIWLDYIRRGLITSGELARLVREDGLKGVTSNPAIFEKAIAGSTDYADTLRAMDESRELGPMAIYEQLAIRDIQDAAEVLRPVYEHSKRRDGYVSLEVSPYLAHDTARTIAEAHRLWKAVRRENVMIKVPGTTEGVPAIEQLINEGININVTLLFSMEAYEQVAEAYVRGLEKLIGAGGDPGRVASVASFFISRIDSLVDSQLNARIKAAVGSQQAGLASSLLGKVAIANGKLTYQRYQEIFRGPRWEALAKRGAQTQRVLWASTSTKNPHYRDVVYVEELIGPDTVNTIPPATMDAFRDHGQPRASLTENLPGARDVMANLERAGVSMRQVTDQLLDEGIQLFAEAFDKLLGAVEKSCVACVPPTGQPAEVLATRPAGRRLEGSDSRLALAGQAATPLGARRQTLERRGRGQLAGLARHHRRPTPPPPAPQGCGRRRPPVRIHQRAAAGHGRVQPCPRSAGHDLWPRCRLSATACARFR